MKSIVYTARDKRRILLEARYIYTEDLLCKKWSLSRYQLRKMKQEANYTYFQPTLSEMVIVALRHGGDTVSKIISYLDYLDHTIYTDIEIIEVLKELVAEGIAQEQDGMWRYNLSYSQEDTSFIF